LNNNFKPLLNKSIVLTRSVKQSLEVRRTFEDYGAKVIDLPSLEIVEPDQTDLLDNSIKEIDKFHWIIFSSANGIIFFEKRLNKFNKSLKDLPSSIKIAVVGLKTSSCLEGFGIKADFIPPEFVADSLIHNFPQSAYGLEVLIPRVQSGGRTILAESFSQAGAYVTEVAVYESICPQDFPDNASIALKDKKIDAFVFASSKTVSNTALLLQKKFGSNWKMLIKNIKIISIGPQTSKQCKIDFDRVDAEAIIHSFEGLCDVTIKLFAKSN